MCGRSDGQLLAATGIMSQGDAGWGRSDGQLLAATGIMSQGDAGCPKIEASMTKHFR